MRNAFIAMAASAIFIAGCSHSPSAVPTPNGQTQSKIHLGAVQPHMQFSILYSFHGPDGREPNGSMIQDPSGSLYGTALGTGAARRGVVFRLDAQGNETVLFQFKAGLSTGRQPTAGVIHDASGNLYGTTNVGGTHDLGVVYELDPGGTETVLHSFIGLDGANPVGSLIRDTSGNLYGTTQNGGAANMGVVFKLSPGGHETVVHSFTGSDGANPRGGVIRTASGNLLGTTSNGGANRGFDGVVFKIDSNGNETVLHTFHGGDGASPLAGLVRDSTGNLYGTTVLGGGKDDGVAFKLDPSGHVTVLHSFSGPDGAAPLGPLILDPSGNLYGTTGGGGTSEDGVVFELDPTGNETVLHSFNFTDGWQPVGSLIRDSAGNLYGTTRFGGASSDGEIFELKP